MIQDPPFSRRQIAQKKLTNRNANQAQCGMPHRSGHSPHLPVFSFADLQRHPDIQYIFSEANGRVSEWVNRLGLQKRCLCRQGQSPIQQQTALEFGESLGGGESFHENMVGFGHMVLGRQKGGIPFRLVGEEDQPLGIRIQTAHGIDTRRKSEFRQAFVGAPIRRKLGEHAVGLVKRNNQRIFNRVRS